LNAGLNLPLNSEARKGMLNGALVEWSRQAPTATVKWFDAHIDPCEIVGLADTVKSIGLSFESRDPQGALTWANSMPDDRLRKEMMASITFPWIHDAPEAALQALQQALPDGDAVRTQVVAETVRQWSHIDPSSASAWLSAQPPSPERDQSLMVYTDTISVAEPQRAATWAVSIADPASREAALTQVMREWIQISPDDCVQWCQSQVASLGEPFIDRVKEMIARR
jgi:hypothetical protein